MLILKSPSSFDSITDSNILKLVKMRLDQLGDEIFVAIIIIEAGDSLSEIEQEIGFLYSDQSLRRYLLPRPDFIRFKISALNRFSFVTQK